MIADIPSPSPPAYGDTTTASGGLMQPRVLIVDDEPVMLSLMARSLLRLGYAVTTASNGREALALLAGQRFDLVMLDVVMPEIDGFAVCAELRRNSDVPVIMLTALNRPEDIVRGLELGADNYITKPFHFSEVEARIRAILRRTAHLSEFNAFDVAEIGDLRLVNSCHQAYVAGRLVELTPTEFGLLRYLAGRRDRPVSKEELQHEVWGYSATDSPNLVELAIRRLRTKLEEDPSRPRRVVTVRGMGYRFVVQLAGDTLG